jgi:hypothetical protein
MNRREFISAGGAALLGTAIGRRLLASGTQPASSLGIAWHRDEGSKLFDQVTISGRPLVNHEEKTGLFDAFCQLLEDGKPGAETSLGTSRPAGEMGPVRIALSHQLRRSAGESKENLLEAALSVANKGDKPVEIITGFLSGARPTPNPADQQTYVPLTASTLGDADDDKRRRLKNCRQKVAPDGFLGHYLEPRASDLHNSTTRAALLAPVVDVFGDAGPCHVAFFGASTQAAYFEALQGPSSRAWRIGHRQRLAPGESVNLKAWLLPHAGDAATAWGVFHQYGHHDEFSAIAWPHDVRVHYYDFLGPVETDGHRGGGYDADLAHFAEFHVGMATQHGYYLSYGDFIHPDRKEWKAMPTDPAGPVTMTLEKVKARVDATRKAGVHPAIYMHYAILDEGSPIFEKMRDSIQIDEHGKPVPFGWVGPDTIKKSWRMSQNSRQWRDHLVQQAHWIMELWNPDAIVLDETFAAWGWDHHPDRAGPLSTGGIQLMRELRAAVRSYGPDKALFASDCSMANFCLWGDGEAGDHCYDRLLGQELYRQPPIRYMAALGKKAWLPCAWLYNSLWSVQMDLARKTGAAVGVTNGWGDGFGLTRLPPADKERMLRDIATLVKARSGKNG